MGLRTRLRELLEGRPAAKKGPIGARPTPAMEEEWKELPEQVDGALKKVGSAVVSTWEVGASELARGLVGRSDERTLIERFSDGLVPTLSPFQDLHKGCNSTMDKAWAAARTSGDLRSITPVLMGLVTGAGDRAQVGWAKTADYLGPVFALSADPAGEKARFLEGGAALRDACVARESLLRDGLDRVPHASSLTVGVTEAFDAWQEALVRDVEITVHRYVLAMVKATRR